MKLDDLDQVTTLRTHRRRCEELRRKAEGNPIQILIGYGGHEVEAGSVFNVTPIREAIVRECDAFLEENTIQLNRLGVTP